MHAQNDHLALVFCLDIHLLGVGKDVGGISHKKLFPGQFAPEQQIRADSLAVSDWRPIVLISIIKLERRGSYFLE